MTTDAAARTTIHLVPHTHWDREWYRPFQSFRMQLVDLVDRVLEHARGGARLRVHARRPAGHDRRLPRDPTRAGGAHRAARAIRSARHRPVADPDGRVPRLRRDAGPQPGGRLGAGARLRRADEGRVPARHVRPRRADAADPAPGRRWPTRSCGAAIPASVDRHAFRWESPDGSWVRAEYLPAGYGNAAGMFAVPDRLDAAAERFHEWARPWFGDDPVLAMYGTDHTAPEPELAALVGRLNEVHESSDLRISTLAQYVSAAPALTDDDPCWRGEMRSGRARQRADGRGERPDRHQAGRRTRRDAAGALRGAADRAPCRRRRRGRRRSWRLAWGSVIQNSAHDSICGCSIDPVVDQVLVRFAEAEQVATTLARRAAATVAASVPRGALTVVNPSPAARTGLIEAELPIPADVGVGRARASRTARASRRRSSSRKEPILFDASIRGDEVDDLFRRFHGREIFDHAWNGYRIDGRTVTLEVDDDPDPAWLDVDGLRAEVVAAMHSAPDETWQVGSWRALGARWQRRSPRRRSAGRPPARWRARANLVSPVRVAPDGTIDEQRAALGRRGGRRLAPTRDRRRRDGGGRRPHRRRRRLRRLLQLRAAGDGHGRRRARIGVGTTADLLGPVRGRLVGDAPATRGRPASRRTDPLERRRPIDTEVADAGRAARRRAVRAHRPRLRQPRGRSSRPLPRVPCLAPRTPPMPRASSRSWSGA